MSDKSWKAFERRIAKRMGGRRIPVTGERDGADIVAGPFVYQAKLRKGVPDYLKWWLRGIVSAALRRPCYMPDASSSCPGHIGVVVWKAPGDRDDNAMVVLRFKDWEALHGGGSTEA